MGSSAHRHLLGALALLVPAAVLSCSGASRQTDTATPTNPQFVTAERIAASGASTAWDALRLTVPILQFREDGRGVPVRITRRGRSSVSLDDQPRVWVDNVRIVNIRDLDLLPAADILSIEVLSGLDGTTYYGGSSTTGVILIRTKPGGS